WARDDSSVNPQYHEAKLRLACKQYLATLRASSEKEIVPLLRIARQRECQDAGFGRRDAMVGKRLGVMEQFLSIARRPRIVRRKVRQPKAVPVPSWSSLKKLLPPPKEPARAGS